MDVKGAKALSERLAEAARNVDPPPAQAVDSEDTDRGSDTPTRRRSRLHGRRLAAFDARRRRLSFDDANEWRESVLT